MVLTDRCEKIEILRLQCQCVYRMCHVVAAIRPVISLMLKSFGWQTCEFRISIGKLSECLKGVDPQQLRGMPDKLKEIDLHFIDSH